MASRATTRILRILRLIKLAHTAAWALFASAILAIPVLTWIGELRGALWLSSLVYCEVVVLLANRMRCPLTAIAARYTDDRSDNFDIYLPAGLARHNKAIFGSLFVVAEAFLLWRWVTA
jgi:hypothetical protein